MKKFEYLELKFVIGPYSEDKLNELGEQGWELVAVVPYNSTWNTSFKAFFKREK